VTSSIRTMTQQARTQVPALRSIVREAGRAIMEVYGGSFAVETKDDDSPLTEADRASHRIIAAGLSRLDSPLASIPILSEEGTMPDSEERGTWTAWWLIDPLDGTKEFVKRNGEFTVNVALVVRPDAGAPGVPVAGWVGAPVPDILYEGIDGMGALRIDADGEHSLPLEPPADPPRIVASRSHRTPPTELVIEAVAELFGIGDIVSSGSSLKLCRIAEGTAELYPRPAPTMEWDTAAADAVCRSAEARVVQALSGDDLEYGKDDLLNPWFLVSRDDALIATAVKALGGDA